VVVDKAVNNVKVAVVVDKVVVVAVVIDKAVVVVGKAMAGKDFVVVGKAMAVDAEGQFVFNVYSLYE
jgi:hypothetical protein